MIFSENRYPPRITCGAGFFGIMRAPARAPSAGTRPSARGAWTQVPDEAVITEPNKFGRPLVWLDQRQDIRCFIPGSGL
jgi:hypothetical protein